MNDLIPPDEIHVPFQKAIDFDILALEGVLTDEHKYLLATAEREAAHRMCETLKSTAAYFEMLETATGVVHPQLAEIRATLAEAEAEYPVQGRNR